MALADLDTTKSEERSETLRKLEALGETDVHKWMEYWRKKGFLA